MHDRYQLSFTQVDHLAALTGWDSSSDWDTRLQSSSAACASLVDASLIGKFGPEIGRQIIDICTLLREVFTDKDKYVKFLDHKRDGETAKDLLDVLQKLLDYAPLDPQFRPLLYVALVRLCRKSELCPRSFTLRGVTNREKEALSPGQFGDVYAAYYKNSIVCVKGVKVYRQRDSLADFSRRKDSVKKAFTREAVVWSQLRHKNVLPFYGTWDPEDQFYLVSPFIRNGDVNQYLTDKPKTNRTHLCANVLVAEPEQALLTDFGFSYVTDDAGLNTGDFLLSSRHAMGGTRPFEAPERVIDPKMRRNGASDVFAFGMLCLEMFALDGYYIQSVHDGIIHRSKLPERPIQFLSLGLNDNMWKVMKESWSPGPRDRPTATEIVRKLPTSSQKDISYNPKIRDFKLSDAASFTKALDHLRAL
ncbi:hypothetical protein C0993_003601 [Termitomyces sp. T159_Od127]|nr:hypothetical protein C0993_003601 [Termitomyces sp. T159_Od127]